MASAYLSRRRIEETIRFTKQSYDLEDIRVMTYDRRRNMVALVNAAAFFTAIALGTKVKLQILTSYLLRAAKRLFGIPDPLLRPGRRHCRGLRQEPPAVTHQRR